MLDADAREWFGEGPGRVILACPPERAEALEGVPLRRIGVVGGDSLLGVRLAELGAAWEPDA